ncbi:Abnormal spindle-like microcephaly-associated protein [Cercospora beticola]|uniref:Abnormal spindle-like microcephaly-associated protein n=1 Tax=Cercospora beticola TaxID=122368 RepID=A0A2G5HIU9_CERBT|nr:Abnormal spindle-like microcephaly-associated protein [Cercospora beticola]PIA92142.1 Abnormal spindle-like microcephaly-associated protein [Cercospora beticola]WPB06075.1 hypothetical protein RHO25_010732 [Cercospora beticola]
MSRISITSQTPCPAPAALDPSHRRISSFELFGDDTTNIDYTRAIDQPLTGIKPRRRSMMGGPARKKAAPVTIFEDVSEESEITAGEVKKPVLGNNHQVSHSTLLGKPPAKRPHGMAGGGSTSGTASSIGLGMASLRIQDSRTGCNGGNDGSQGRISAGGRMSIGGCGGPVGGNASWESRRMIGMGGNRLHPGRTNVSEELPRGSGGASLGLGSTVRKPPRRQTIFVPEDTTVMTIHPGARDDTHRIEDTFHLPSLTGHRELQSEENSGVTQKPVRKSRSSLLVAPKRLPLRETPSTENIPGWDVAGADTGKENLPPAGQVLAQKAVKSFGIVEPTETRTLPRSLYAPTQASRSRQSIVPRAHAQLTSAPSQIPPGMKMHTTIDFRKDRPKDKPRKTITFMPIDERDAFAHTLNTTGETTCRPTAPVHADDHSPPLKAGSKLDEEKQRIREFVASKRNEQQLAKLQQYPILEGNLSQPALYEDKWLSFQEVALSEVINGIFQLTSPAPAIHASAAGESLREQLVNLYNRPEVASLHSRLQASLKYGALAHPQHSIGTHQPTQDLGLRKRLMKMWLEVYNNQILIEAAQVVAGRQVLQPLNTSPGSSLDPRSGKRAQTAFLEDFFVCVVDVDADPHATSDESLDTLRWQKTMLRSLMLAWLLDQSAEVGIVDGGCLITRDSSIKTTESVLQTLGRHMFPACGDIIRTLKHLQYDVQYRQDPLKEVVYHVTNIATDFRDGVFLTRLVETFLYEHMDLKKSENTLSQFLKLPGENSSQRSYNVQVALRALSAYDVSTANMVADIATEDIVNGHREKTLSLLWSLVSNYGLSYLVDWKKLAADIDRVAGHALANLPVSPAEQEELLQQWAAAYATQAGLHVDNLSTSFADGKVYAAILSTFVEKLNVKPDVPSVLGQLRAVGCSQAFSEKIAGSVGVVVGKETVVSNLTFLASRLLLLV